ATLLLDAGLDPTISVGGEVDRWGGTGRLGTSEWVVAEACESDGTFLRYRPAVAVVTNLEPEHLDRYQGSFAALVAAFERFVKGLPNDGLLVLCADDPRLRALAPLAPGRVVTYGLAPDADVRAVHLQPGEVGWSFDAVSQGTALGRFRLAIPGRHNVVNALAAIAVGREIGLDPATMATSLAGFRGAHRRFEIVAEQAGLTIVDDYAHHPTEIQATLAAARERARGRVFAVFQPQRYTRTQSLMAEFSRAFAQADEVILTPIYSPPGERPIPGVTGETLAEQVRQHTQARVRFIADRQQIVDLLQHEARGGDLIVVMGAGDIYEVAYALAERLAAPRRHHA
ncbi:MAG TPA: UDP-N-acetylmuramate--L-alanine ligase, partial [Bacillota bacterium]